MKKIILTLLILTIASSLFAKEEIVLTGMPEIKISEGGANRVPENLTKDKAIKFKCTITKIDDKYYWALRERRINPYCQWSIHYLLGSQWFRICSCH